MPKTSVLEYWVEGNKDGKVPLQTWSASRVGNDSKISSCGRAVATKTSTELVRAKSHPNTSAAVEGEARATTNTSKGGGSWAGPVRLAMKCDGWCGWANAYLRKLRTQYAAPTNGKICSTLNVVIAKL
uniref:Uncharacterized protein n=1 Tax=Oryza brachyantha TaxID=4533 RepID=J3M5M6_ORYBR